MSKVNTTGLILSENYPPIVGGSARWVHRIVERWPGKAEVWAAWQPGSPRCERAGTLTVRRRRFCYPSWAPDCLDSALSYANWTAGVLAEASRFQPGVQLVGRALPEGLWAWAVRRVLGVPYAVLIHGEEVGTCMSSGSLARELRLVLGGASLVVANSENSRRLVLEAGADAGRCVVVHPGADVEHFAAPAQTQTWREKLDVRGKVILSVGRLERRKNHVATVRAAAALRRSGVDVEYLIAGTGEKRDAILAEARREGVAEHVHLLGRVDDDDLPALYQLADVFALPGLGSQTSFEGFGIVFIEAAAAGTPSVSGRAGGTGEAVLDGQTGLVVDGHRDEEIFGALRELLTDESKRAALAARAHQRALSEFSWSKSVKQFFEAMGRYVCEGFAV